MRYVAFFKTHKWDDLTERQYSRFKKSVLTGDVFILYDITSSSPPDRLENIIPISSSEMETIGLVDRGGFWYNGDYGAIIAFLKKPDYDFYVFSEYDVGVFNSIENIVKSMNENEIDIIGENINDDDWIHTGEAQPYYPEIKIEKSLFCIGFYSRVALAAFYRRRLKQAKLYKTGKISSWPIGEAIMATEAKLSNLKYENLHCFCDELSNYNWNQPILEDYIKKIPHEKTFLHPITDYNKFIKVTFDTQFKIDKTLLDKIIYLNDSDVYCKSYFMKENSIEDREMIYKYYCENIGNFYFDFIGKNIISYGCKAYQSSTSEYSVFSHESERVLNLLPRKHFSMHTKEEDFPWWFVDLGEKRYVENVYIFDRPDLGGFRTYALQLSASNDLNNWEIFFEKNNHDLLVNKKVEVNKIFRYIKININGLGILNLDTILVSGGKN